MADAADQLQLEEPPLPDPDEYGPEDPDDYVILTPEERPFTAIILDTNAAFLGGAIRATAHVVVHATDVETATMNALKAALRAGVTSPELLFLTEGKHEDVSVDGRTRKRA